ncbi:N-formyl peptide receptor 2-like [Paroedura picta]|uniref:N-formyl peptide receptor 2-like n=1 Tax=Paroedura picta TaxID=143630 RepID=UPI004055DA82
MNISTAHQNDTSPRVDEVMRHIGIVTNVVILVLGGLGNGLVVWVTATRKKRNNFTLTCYLNLAVADLFFSLGRIPALVQEVMYNYWPFGNLLCKLHAFARYLTVFTGVFVLTLISVDRCLLVAQPIWARNHRGPKFQALLCTGAWILALVFSLPYLVVREVTVKYGAMYCGYRKDFKIATELPLRLSRFFGGFLIPFAIILSAYLVLVFKLHNRRWEGSHRTFAMVAAIVVLFFICWLPHHVVALISTLWGSKDSWGIALKLSNALAYLHSCINPVIYVLVGYIRSRRLHRRASFLGLFRKALTEEDENSTGAEVTQRLNQKT